jgi:hypothetical protein
MADSSFRKPGSILTFYLRKGKMELEEGLKGEGRGSQKHLLYERLLSKSAHQAQGKGRHRL